jgi:acyl transferase domain-containing protein
MAAVELSAAALRERIAPYADRVAIAAINSPASTLVSGEPGAIERLLTELAEAQVFARAIQVDYASHGAQVEAIREELEQSLQGVALGRLSIPLYSTVTGGKVEPDELDAGYWYRNLRQTVRFAEAVDQLLSDGHRFFIEVSPHPVLSLGLRESASAANANVAIVGTLRRDQGGAERLLLSLGELIVRGLGCDWKPLLPSGKRVPLPTYPFERQRYWLEAGGGTHGDVASAGLASAEHPLLGASIAVAQGDSFVFTGRLSLATHPWLAGHVVFGAVLLPGTGFVELALAAAQRVGLDTVDELTIEAPLVVPERGAIQIQLLIGALDESQRRSLSVHARAAGDSEDGWRRHASGALSFAGSMPAQDLRVWPPAGAVAIELDGLYERAAEAGLRYRDAFCGLRAVYQRGQELFAQVELPATASQEASRFGLHPALLDAALHALLTIQPTGAGVALPFAWSGVQLHARGAEALRVRLTQADGQGSVSLLLADAAGEPVGSVQALRARPAVASQFQGASPLRCRAPPSLPPHPSLIGRGWAVRRKACRRRRRATSILARCKRGYHRAIVRRHLWCCRASQAWRPTIRPLPHTRPRTSCSVPCKRCWARSASRTAGCWWSPGVPLPYMLKKTYWTWRAPRCGAWCALRSASTPVASLCWISIRLSPSKPGTAPSAARSLSWGCDRTSSARRDWLGQDQTSCSYPKAVLLGRCRFRPEARLTISW